MVSLNLDSINITTQEEHHDRGNVEKPRRFTKRIRM